MHPMQAAALVGVGLLYQGTCNRQMVEICLKEISRSPTASSLQVCVIRMLKF